MTTLGIIGFGTMGQAIALGLRAADAPFAVRVYDKSPERTREAERHNLEAAGDLAGLCRESEALLVAVKPQDLAGLVAEAASHKPAGMILTIVAGRSMELFSRAFATTNVARLMPNIAATRREAFVGLSVHPKASAQTRETAWQIAGALGLTVEVPEALLSAVTGIAGSGIAYVFSFLHAMALGGVHAGLPYDTALRAAVQTVRGAVALLGVPDPPSGRPHPVELLTTVTSPAGTTIEGVRALEDGGFTAAVMAAVKNASDRAAELERVASGGDEGPRRP